MDPATALPPAPPQRKATSSAESESSSAHDEDDLSLASGWSDEERASQGDGQPRVNDKSPTIDNDVQDSLLVVSTSATDVETLRVILSLPLSPYAYLKSAQIADLESVHVLFYVLCHVSCVMYGAVLYLCILHTVTDRSAS